MERKGSEAQFWSGVDYASRFFMGDADVQRALTKVVADLEDAKIPYAIAGAMALNGYGCGRVTVDIVCCSPPKGLGKAGILPLPKLVELKLASGMSAPHRMKDLSDVLELIRIVKLPRDFAGQLEASVRAKYDELWAAAASAPNDE